MLAQNSFSHSDDLEPSKDRTAQKYATGPGKRESLDVNDSQSSTIGGSKILSPRPPSDHRVRSKEVVPNGVLSNLKYYSTAFIDFRII